jgi:hypothetical protein
MQNYYSRLVSGQSQHASSAPGGTRLSQAQFTEERARQTLVRHSAALPPAALRKHPHAISTQAVCCGMLAAV